MSAGTRRRLLPVALLAPFAAVPALAMLLMEFGPERSFLFAVYLLVWAIVFLAAGIVVAKRRPSATTGQVIARAAAWALVILAVALIALLALSLVMVPRTP
jgi:hypothetical protein